MWAIRIDRRAYKALKKIDRKNQARILRYLRDKVAGSEDPKQIAKLLQTPARKFWRFRVGNYRIIATISTESHDVFVWEISHRQSVYKSLDHLDS